MVVIMLRRWIRMPGVKACYLWDKCLRVREALKPCYNCNSRNYCFLRKIPLNHYPEHVQNFVITIPNSAFANTGGGHIIFGVNEDKKEIREVEWNNARNGTG